MRAIPFAPGEHRWPKPAERRAKAAAAESHIQDLTSIRPVSRKNPPFAGVTAVYVLSLLVRADEVIDQFLSFSSMRC
jgi:hypothetical protein